MAVKQGLSTQTIIYLLRNDLRLHDNECFHFIDSLLKGCQRRKTGGNDTPLRLVPLYCFQPEHYQTGTYHFGFSRIGRPRARFLLETVKDLKHQLQSKGSDLVVRSCFRNSACINLTQAVLNIIEQLGLKSREQTGDQEIHSSCTLIFHKEATQEETDAEYSLRQLCKRYGIHVKTFWGASLYHKEDLPFNKIIRNGFQIPDVPDVYTKFRKAVESKSKVRSLFRIPVILPPLPCNVVSEELPSIIQVLNSSRSDSSNPDDALNKSAFPFKGGESAALERVNEYLWETNAIATYKESRNGLIGTQYSTKFSPWLANGSLSPRYIHAEVKRYESSKVANQSTYWVIFELIWRDFFRFVCLKYGSRVFHAGGIRGLKVRWKQDLGLFDKWRKGNTGVPFIDANMRELLKTGWMSNRGRQNVASFLIKDLKLDWRMGAEWFESMLIDHDVCSNYGNWNYAAGIGNDPRVGRKFNIVKQGLDYDPNGDFIQIWVPELANLTKQNTLKKGTIHFPWKVPISDLKKAGIRLGVTYPRPIIVAGEWNRHYNRGINNKSRKLVRRTGSRTGSQTGSQSEWKRHYNKVKSNKSRKPVYRTGSRTRKDSENQSVQTDFDNQSWQSVRRTYPSNKFKKSIRSSGWAHKLV